MSSYPLSKCKNSRTLHPIHNFNTEEYNTEHNDLVLLEGLKEIKPYTHVRRYRLYSREEMSFAESLNYDIKCPHCGDTLRLCAGHVDFHNMGLYYCERCDKEKR